MLFKIIPAMPDNGKIPRRRRRGCAWVVLAGFVACVRMHATGYWREPVRVCDYYNMST